MLFSPIRFLHGKYYFRRHRVRSMFPPEPVDLLTTNDRQYGEKLYRFERIPRATRTTERTTQGMFAGRRWGASVSVHPSGVAPRASMRRAGKARD
jgi:hypothetical protein